MEGPRDLYHPNQKIDQAIQIITRWVYADMLTVGSPPSLSGRLNLDRDRTRRPMACWFGPQQVPQRFGPPNRFIHDQRAILILSLLTHSFPFLNGYSVLFHLIYSNSFSAVSTRGWYVAVLRTRGSQSIITVLVARGLSTSCYPFIALYRLSLPIFSYFFGRVYST